MGCDGSRGRSRDVGVASPAGVATIDWSHTDVRQYTLRVGGSQSRDGSEADLVPLPRRGRSGNVERTAEADSCSTRGRRLPPGGWGWVVGVELSGGAACYLAEAGASGVKEKAAVRCRQEC